VQLCALRWLGFVPEELTAIPQPALLSLRDQLEANAADLDTYGARGQTRTDQLAAARTHAGFRPWDAPEASALEAWLTVRAMEHERPRSTPLTRGSRSSVRAVLPSPPAPGRRIRALAQVATAELR
jgi:hypothetical protein